MDRRKLVTSDVEQLERHFRAGLSANWAASKIGCSFQTAVGYYQDFTARKIPRGIYRRKPSARQRYSELRPVHYSGPDWIGSAIAGHTAPAPIGPEWIGSAIPR